MQAIAEKESQPKNEETQLGRRGKAWIETLKTFPQFDLIVTKIRRGESNSAISRWFERQEDKGGCAHLTRATFRRYLAALAIAINTGFQPDAYTNETRRKQMLRKVQAAIVDPNAPIPESIQSLIEQISGSVEKVDSIGILRVAYMLQEGRIQRILKVEERTGLPMKGLQESIAQLVDIAAEMRKWEVSEQLLEAKVKQITNPQLLNSSYVPTSDEEKEFTSLNEVDRHLMRDATAKMLTLIERARASSPVEREPISDAVLEMKPEQDAPSEPENI